VGQAFLPASSKDGRLESLPYESRAMRVVVGLGNPGKQYHGTRHNVGFAVIDGLASSPSAGRFQSRFAAQVAELQEGDQKVLLVKPETFMNLSGRCVRQVMDFYQLELADLLVVCDDANLPLGKLRVRGKGTHGGHNGLRDIQNHLGTTEYPRLRIGVGAAGEKGEMVDHVLGRFRPSERPVIDDAISLSVQAVSVWIQQGIEVCMNRFNAPPGQEAG
jgi:peptidyl-tRNA hydrolase, PTH1 family